MSWNCKRCDFELVEIHKDTILKILDELKNPNFRSLPTDWNSMEGDWIKICPSCDKGPLGFNTDKRFPSRTQSGEHTSIHDLDFVKAHLHSEYAKEILRSDICGCFYCCETFKPEEIDQWHGEDC